MRRRSPFQDRFSAIQSHPRVALKMPMFYCNGVALDLSRKPVAAKAIKAFIASSKGVLHRDELLAVVSPRLPHGKSTKRYSAARLNCLSRMMCRLRFEFSNHFYSVIPNGVHWFYYDITTESWVFYKLAGEGYDGEFYA